LVTIMDMKNILYYQEIVDELRSSGIRAELFLGNPKDLGKQLKYADQRNSRLAIIAGSEEFERGNVQVKDLDLGSRMASTVKTNKEWKGQPAQIEISRKDLVEHIKDFYSKLI
ncbi:MAG: histidine--tRNA ligase, partial [Rhodobacteraceae bacterium]|nr:histidine--tRNA ligase [Paracoccaceae bacterium]